LRRHAAIGDQIVFPILQHHDLRSAAAVTGDDCGALAREAQGRGLAKLRFDPVIMAILPSSLFIAIAPQP
jgi:hypothetical protein